MVEEYEESKQREIERRMASSAWVQRPMKSRLTIAGGSMLFAWVILLVIALGVLQSSASGLVVVDAAVLLGVLVAAIAVVFVAVPAAVVGWLARTTSMSQSELDAFNSSSMSRVPRDDELWRAAPGGVPVVKPGPTPEESERALQQRLDRLETRGEQSG